jgi:hypothetical protein
MTAPEIGVTTPSKGYVLLDSWYFSQPIELVTGPRDEEDEWLRRFGDPDD